MWKKGNNRLIFAIKYHGMVIKSCVIFNGNLLWFMRNFACWNCTITHRLSDRYMYRCLSMVLSLSRRKFKLDFFYCFLSLLVSLSTKKKMNGNQMTLMLRNFLNVYPQLLFLQRTKVLSNKIMINLCKFYQTMNLCCSTQKKSKRVSLKVSFSVITICLWGIELNLYFLEPKIIWWVSNCEVVNCDTK